MNRFRDLFKTSKCAVIGMIHVKSLPGTPMSRMGVKKLVDLACGEAELYKKYKLDGVLIENTFDVPYVKASQSSPEITACMTRICSEVKRILPSIPCGIQVLAGHNHAALAVALASGCQFVRVEGFTFAHVGDEGLIEACAGPLLRYRKMISAEDILVFCDIKKKHSSHAITADVNISETASAVKFFKGDAVIVTGGATGVAPTIADVESARTGNSLPVLIGSGINANNVKNFISADGIIIGSHFKQSDSWENDLEEEKILRFMQTVDNLRDELNPI